eukprot:19852-Heterococcus_DN1.PRE.1
MSVGISCNELCAKAVDGAYAGTAAQGVSLSTVQQKAFNAANDSFVQQAVPCCVHSIYYCTACTASGMPSACGELAPPIQNKKDAT